MLNLDASTRAIQAYLLKVTGFNAGCMLESVFLRRLDSRSRDCGHPEREDYLNFLRNDKMEARLLHASLCAQPVKFLSPRHSFDSLAAFLSVKILPALQKRDELRIWVPACGSGAEAYAMAMLVLSLPEWNSHALNLRIFATDSSEQLIAEASLGRFRKEVIESEVPQHMLGFWHRHDDHYTPKDTLRKQITFAQHDPLRNPPFPRIHVLNLRNLLPWLSEEASEQAVGSILYALLPGGVLLTSSQPVPRNLADATSAIEGHPDLLRPSPDARNNPSSSIIRGFTPPPAWMPRRRAPWQGFANSAPHCFQ